MAALIAHSAVRAADVSPAQAVPVTSISGSRSTTNGYFAFTSSAAVVGCEAGFWLPASDPSYSSMLMAVKAALGTKASMRVSGDRNQLMPGSTDHYCRIVQAN